jgi:hypothetical protein
MFLALLSIQGSARLILEGTKKYPLFFRLDIDISGISLENSVTDVLN